MTPYEVLGVRPGASAEEIRRAYVRLARQHHPDVVEPARREVAEQRMRAINEAWAVLGDAGRRARLEDDARATFRPFSPPAPDDEDGRDAPDQPYRPVAPAITQRAAQIRMAPVALFALAVVVGAIGLVVNVPGLLSGAVVLFILSCVAVLVVALVTMVEATRDE